MEDWQERAIPLHIVIRAIEQVFDNFDKNPGPRTIKGLMFCREEVEAQYDEWRKGQAGKPGEVQSVGIEQSAEDICDHLRGLVASLKLNSTPALQESIERACSRLHEIIGNMGNDHAQVDLSLKDVESLLDDALLNSTDRNVFKMAEKEVTGHLRAYKSTMEADAYKSTHRLMLLKRLREEENLPRLSLFYL